MKYTIKDTNTEIGDYKIDVECGIATCSKINNDDSEVILWEEPEIYPQESESEIRKDIDLIPNKIHYHDFNTIELYNAYSKISGMISRFEEFNKNPRNLRGNLSNKFTMNELRLYCQTWLDDVRFRQDGKDRWWVWDKIKYFFRGQLKQRKMWLQTFGSICWDMSTRLDAIDGGMDAEVNEQVNKHMGF